MVDAELEQDIEDGIGLVLLHTAEGGGRLQQPNTTQIRCYALMESAPEDSSQCKHPGLAVAKLLSVHRF